MNDVAYIFNKKEKCFSELNQARKLFSNKDTTRKQYDAMQYTLGLMLLYCPDEIRSLVEATLTEASMREFYFVTNIWKD